jgi:hypothetical protein
LPEKEQDKKKKIKLTRPTDPNEIEADREAEEPMQ